MLLCESFNGEKLAAGYIIHFLSRNDDSASQRIKDFHAQNLPSTNFSKTLTADIK